MAWSKWKMSRWKSFPFGWTFRMCALNFWSTLDHSRRAYHCMIADINYWDFISWSKHNLKKNNWPNGSDVIPIRCIWLRVQERYKATQYSVDLSKWNYIGKNTIEKKKWYHSCIIQFLIRKQYCVYDFRVDWTVFWRCMSDTICV